MIGAIGSLFRTLKEQALSFFEQDESDNTVLQEAVRSEFGIIDWGEEATDRAREYLNLFLTKEQKEGVLRKERFIEEKGIHGVYRIPYELIDGDGNRIEFMPYPSSFLEKWERYWDTKTEQDYRLYRKFCNPQKICILDSQKVAPWYDVVATCILHIRAGDEKEIFLKGASFNYVFTPVNERRSL